MNETQAKFSGKPADMADEMAATVPKNLQEAFARVVQAGMKVMFSEQTHELLLQQLNQEGEIGDNIGQGMAGMMLLLYQKSNQTMPPEIIVPAGVFLMMQGADFLEKVTQQDLTPAILAQAMQVMIDTLLDKFGVQKDQFYSAVDKAAAGGYSE